MSFSIGIVGLPNVGKSTLFNALTRSKQANAQNYPFCTIDPNVGVVEVPDERLTKLAEVSKSQKIIPTTIEFVDIAGLVKGASQGEGLGNQFLSHIREVDAIAQVVRAFEDDNIIHVHNRVNPREDAEIINTELVLADLQTVEKRLGNVKKAAKGVVAKEIKAEIEILEKVYNHLQQNLPARKLELNEEEAEIVRELHLLTMKPMMYIINTLEQNLNTPLTSLEGGFEGAQQNPPSERGRGVFNDCLQITVCAELEAQLAELSPDEAREYLRTAGIEKTGLDKIIVAGYKLLNLITYFTSGEPETRAWTIPTNTKAPEAAGVIHTDFIKGFIKADVISWQDFVELGGWGKLKESGKMRLEGKEYVVKDGDVVYFHIG